LVSFAADIGATSGQVALAWILAKHPHVVAIPGAKHARHVDENTAATRIKLSAKQIETLDALFAPAVIVGDRYPKAAMAGIED
jgi:aryl-alcohol dehydrogenase-like predicted oxidoreductase